MSNRFNAIWTLLGAPLQFGGSPQPNCARPLPPAYTEWASLNGAAELLHRCSNTDHFWFDPGEEDFVATPLGEIVLFSRESQGNFELGVVVSTDAEDPPVLYSDYRRDRWTEYCATFTGALFTQVFDWQFRLVFNDAAIAEIDYYETLNAGVSDDTLAVLRQMYVEHPTTKWFMDSATDATTWRFSTPDGERIVLNHDPADATHWIEITAPVEDRVERCRAVREHLEKCFLDEWNVSRTSAGSRR